MKAVDVVVREVITTALELVGLLLINAAVAVLLARVDLALGLATAGALLLADSWLIVRRAPTSKGGDDE